MGRKLAATCADASSIYTRFRTNLCWVTARRTISSAKRFSDISTRKTPCGRCSFRW